MKLMLIGFILVVSTPSTFGQDDGDDEGYLSIEEAGPGSRSASNSKPKEVKFKLSAKKLEKKDLADESDPYVVISYTMHKVKGETAVGKTSVIQDNSNPTWGETFSVLYKPGHNQRLRFIIWDKDRTSDDKIADVKIRVGEIAKSKSKTTDILLNPGHLIIERV